MTYYEPQRTILIFGNGLQGRIIDERPGYTNDEGVEEVEFVIQPSEELKTYYNLTNEDLDHDGFITRRYPVSDIRPANLSPISPTTIIITGFNWEQTIFTKKSIERELIQDLQIKVKTLQRAKAHLQEENRKLLTQVREWAKEHTDIAQEFRRSLGNASQDDETDPNQQPYPGGQ